MAQAQTRTIATGSDGNVAFAALNSGYVPQGRFSSWNLNVFQVINNVTKFSSTGAVWQEFIGGAHGATWGATASHEIGAATSNPFGGTVTDNVLAHGGATATFTCASASIFTGLTACNIVWPVIVQTHSIGSDATGGLYSSLGGVCNGAPTAIAWDES